MLVQIWDAGGAHADWLLGGLGCMRVMVGLIRTFVDAPQVFGSERDADSRVCAGARQAVDTLVSSLQRHTARQNKDPAQRRILGCRWWNAGGADEDVVVPRSGVWPPGADGAGRGSAGRSRLQGRGVGEKAGGQGVIPPPAKLRLRWLQRWVPPTTLRLLSWISGVLVWRCHARLPNVLASLPKFLMTSRWLVACSLLVTGQSSGK